MRLALAEAKKAEMLHEVPIGAVVVLDGKVIGRGYNLRETTQDATTHAEMLAIKEACEKWEAGAWKMLHFCYLRALSYVQRRDDLSRVAEVYFGAYDPKAEQPVP